MSGWSVGVKTKSSDSVTKKSCLLKVVNKLKKELFIVFSCFTCMHKLLLHKLSHYITLIILFQPYWPYYAKFMKFRLLWHYLHDFHSNISM